MQVSHDILLREADVLARISFGRTKFWSMIKTGEFPQPIRIGGSVRWSENAVMEWIAKKIEAASNNRPKRVAA